MRSKFGDELKEKLEIRCIVCQTQKNFDNTFVTFDCCQNKNGTCKLCLDTMIKTINGQIYGPKITYSYEKPQKMFGMICPCCGMANPRVNPNNCVSLKLKNIGLNECSNHKYIEKELEISKNTILKLEEINKVLRNRIASLLGLRTRELEFIRKKREYDNELKEKRKLMAIKEKELEKKIHEFKKREERVENMMKEVKRNYERYILL